LMRRLYNLTFHADAGVVPFYYEISEGKRWAVDFCKDFFLSFIFQYIAFVSRKPEYIDHPLRHSLSGALKMAETEKLGYLADYIEQMGMLIEDESVYNLWQYVRETPYTLATRQNEFIVQIIDEFQFLNSEICRDKMAERPIKDFAAGYLRTAEFKNAPLLVSGSWVGWLMNDLVMMLPGRFILSEFQNMPESEAVEMAFNYSRIKDIPVTEETAYLMADVGEGNPFYISAFFESQCPDKDLTTKDGLIRTLEFETLDNQGSVKGTWMEYVHSAFQRVNDRNAKRMVLYLCKHRDREVTRDEIRENLKLDMDDATLEKKLGALRRADIIRPGFSNYRYQGVQDNIFDKVFRGVYAEEIEAFDPGDIADEYRRMFQRSEEKYRRLLGKFNQMKGVYAEFLIIRQLRYRAHRENERFCSMTENLPGDFRFADYESVWTYRYSPIDKRDFEIDVFARAPEGDYSIIGEVKNRTRKKYSEKEAGDFSRKMAAVAEKERVGRPLGFVFSIAGFTKGAVAYFEKNGIAWSEDDRWLDA